MEKSNSVSRFEEDIRQSFGAPKIRSEFVAQLHDQLIQKAVEKSSKAVPSFRLRPAWIVAIAVLSVMIVGTLVIGPQRVFAAVRGLLGYIPDVGIVDNSAPIRVLAEPVSLTRDGVTISVNQVVLTASETQLNYGISGVPLAAYPKGEEITGCVEKEYLRLPDGAPINLHDPVPAEVKEATFVLPCIFNTLPGTAPTDWELQLSFVPAPADMTILPITDITPSVQPASTLPVEAPIGETNPPADAQDVLATIEKVIDTEDGYILIGALRPRDAVTMAGVQVTGVPLLRDAAGKKVAYTHPQDINPAQLLDLTFKDQGFAIRFEAAGVTFPLALEFQGVVLNIKDSQASATLTFDVGSNPSPGQKWVLNQNIQLAGHDLKLVSVTTDSQNGYDFELSVSPSIYSVGVQIEGYTAAGGGGGGNYQDGLHRSLSFAELPKGNLTLVFSNMVLASETQFWQVQWQPDAPRDFEPLPGNDSVCVDADSIAALPVLPAGLEGSVVMTQMNPKLQIVLARMDSSQQQIIAEDSARAAVSLAGTHLAHTTTEGIVIEDLQNGNSSVIVGAFGRDLHWSTDGSRLAVVNSGDSYGIFVIDSDGKNPKQLSNLGYESIAGWSADGSTLYYAIPGASESGFLLRSVDVQTGNTLDLFSLEDSSRKAPMPALSPDGKQIAYRASNNSSLYLKGMDGSSARLMLENPALAINGLVWSKDSRLLGVSLITTQNQDGEIIVIAPDTCETYRLPGLSGELDGMFIP